MSLKESNITKRADLKGCNFARSDLSYGVFELRRAELMGANLIAANFDAASLRDAKLDKVDVAGANFANADTEGTVLHLVEGTGGAVDSIVSAAGNDGEAS